MVHGPFIHYIIVVFCKTSLFQKIKQRKGRHSKAYSLTEWKKDWSIKSIGVFHSMIFDIHFIIN